MSTSEAFNLPKEELDIIRGLEEILTKQHLVRAPQNIELQALLWWALDFGSDDQLRQILAAGASPNITFPRGTTPIGDVITRTRPGRDRREVVRLLIEAGADLKLPSEGEIPLVLAARHHRLEVLDLLWEAADKRKLKPDQMTAMLLSASTMGSADFTQRLLAAGAPVNATGVTQSAANAGCPLSALMLASFFGHADVVHALLADGANVNLKDGQGHTALDYAKADAKTNRKVISILEKAGALQGKPFRDPRAATRGFAAAAKKPAYKQTIERLKELTGARPRPLEAAEDSIPGAYGFLLEEERARSLVEQYQAEFLAQSSYLFFTRDLADTNGPAVALLPTNDVYLVLAAVETEGANSRVYNEDLIAWLRDLEKEQSFQITGIGSDFVEGKFTLPIRDAAALVKRINQICPGGDEGPETERRQIEDLQRTRRLFLWWD
jgi:ankyrin repeat protein